VLTGFPFYERNQCDCGFVAFFRPSRRTPRARLRTRRTRSCTSRSEVQARKRAALNAACARPSPTQRSRRAASGLKRQTSLAVSDHTRSTRRNEVDERFWRRRAAALSATIDAGERWRDGLSDLESGRAWSELDLSRMFGGKICVDSNG
jgi:hypothetical protein